VPPVGVRVCVAGHKHDEDFFQNLRAPCIFVPSQVDFVSSRLEWRRMIKVIFKCPDLP